MGRRRSAKADAWVIALGVMAVAAAAFAVYWLVLGAIWLVGALVRLALEAPKHRRAATLREATAREVVPAGAFDYQARPGGIPLPTADPGVMARAVAQTFHAWARTLPRAPRDPSALVRGVELHRRLLVRRESTVEGRRLVTRSAPFRGTAADTDAADLRGLDAWMPEAELLERSRRIAPCEACLRHGKVACTRCHGTCTVTCTNCEGAGKAYGLASNGSRRLMNCKVCRKAGRVDCSACLGGEVACGGCDGAGRLTSWLAAESWSRLDVQVEPDDYQRVFHWSKDGEPATRAQMELDAWIIGEVAADRPLADGEAPDAIVADERERILAAVRPQLQLGERVRHQRLLALELPVASVTYGTSRDEQTVQFMGRRLFEPRHWVDTAMRARAQFMNWIAIVLATMPVALGIAYLARGRYFASAEVGGVVASVAVAAVLIYLSLRSTTLGRRRLVWLGLVPVPLAVAVVFGALAEPRLADARAHLARGDLAAAAVELEALGPASDADLAVTYAELHLAQVAAAPSADVAARHLAQIPDTAPQRAAATAHLDTMLLEEGRAAVANGHASEVDAILRRASPALAASADANALLASADVQLGRACLARKEWSCAFARGASAHGRGDAAGTMLQTETAATLRLAVDARIAAAAQTPDLSARVEALTAAEQHLALLEASTGPGSAPPSAELVRLTDQLGRASSALAKQLAADARRAEAAAAAQARSEARAAAKQRAADQRARRAEERASRGLRCCDGTLSPSCMCSGSHRGCCSHHGGICGCE